MATTQLRVIESGMQIVGVPVVPEQLRQKYVAEAMRADPVELPQVFVPKEDFQAALQIMRLSVATCMTFLLRNLPPSVACDTTEEYDALLNWTLASTTMGNAQEH